MYHGPNDNNHSSGRFSNRPPGGHNDGHGGYNSRYNKSYRNNINSANTGNDKPDNSSGGGSGRSLQNYIISPPDKTLVWIVGALIVIGIMAIFSAGSPRAVAEGVNPVFFTVRQLAWLVAGIFGAMVFANYDYRKLRAFTYQLPVAVLVLLLLVQFTPLGLTVNEAKRWLVIGPIQFQPSELAKPAVILMFASLFAQNSQLVDDKKLPAYIIFGASLLLIYKQPNLSMIMLLIFTFAVLYYMAGGSLKKLVISGLSAAAVIAFTIRDYQKQRFLVWLDPNKDPLNAGYNIIQSLVAFVEGGFFGVGFGNSKQKLSWLPEGHTDFIFAVIAEEFGFLGCFFIIMLFAMFLHRSFIIASRSPDMFGKLLATGIAFSVGFQAFMNMSVASSFIPATGIPLPFISYGGSSLFVSLCMFGVLLNISKKRVQRIRPYAKKAAYQ